MSGTCAMQRYGAIWQSSFILISPRERASRKSCETRFSRKFGAKLSASIIKAHPPVLRRSRRQRVEEAAYQLLFANRIRARLAASEARSATERRQRPGLKASASAPAGAGRIWSTTYGHCEFRSAYEQERLLG